MNDSSTIDDSFLPILKSAILFSAGNQAYCVYHRGISQFVFSLNKSAEILLRKAQRCLSFSQLVEAYGEALAIPSDIAAELISMMREDWEAAGAIGADVRAFSLPDAAAAATPPITNPVFDEIVFVGCEPVRAIIHDSELAFVTTPMIRNTHSPYDAQVTYVITAWRDGEVWHVHDNRSNTKVFNEVQDARDTILTSIVEHSRPNLEDAPGIHGATMRMPSGRHIMLSGDSGRGKTTLALGLAKHGFTLLSDDICSFDERNGLVVPVMMNPSVKQGAWQPLADLYPELEEQEPVDIKGRLCKYITRQTDPGDDAPHCIDALIFPNWQAGASTRLAHFDGNDALLSMLRWSYLPNNQESLQAMADFLSAIPLYELTYSEFSEAKSVITDLLRCPK